MIKLVLTDLDGTLIPDAQEGVSPNTEAAIRELKAAGIAFGPCTGRPVNMLPDLFHNQLDLYATGVYENGTLGFIDGVEAFRHTYPGKALNRLGHFVAEQGFSELTLFDPLHGPSERYGKERLEELDQLDLSAYSKANLHFDSLEELPGIAEVLRARFPEFDFVMPVTDQALLDILPHGISKANGALELAQRMGIAPEEVLVFGDSDNDFEFLSAFPHSVAMANGSEKVKATARYTIGQSKDYAVAAALRELAAYARKES